MTMLHSLISPLSGEADVMAGSEAPIGRNILELTNIQQSENFSCIAASTLGTIEANTFVRVQGTLLHSGLLSLQIG